MADLKQHFKAYHPGQEASWLKVDNSPTNSKYLNFDKFLDDFTVKLQLKPGWKANKGGRPRLSKANMSDKPGKKRSNPREDAHAAPRATESQKTT